MKDKDDKPAKPTTPKKPSSAKKTAAPEVDTQDTGKSTVGGRMKRYARVSTTMTGLAARMAGEKYLGFSIDRPDHAKKLMEQLGNLKGPLLKVAQLLSTIPNALPKEYATELQKLQSQAPPMGWPFVRRRMMAELGNDWEEKFKSFEKEAAAAASLGQVHRAVMHDGLRVACKLQYPDMASAIDADLSQLKVIFGLFEKYDQSIGTGEIQKEIADRLHEELDYTLEAKHQKLYGYMLRDEAEHVRVPKIIDELSTKRLLTSVWHDGSPIMGYVKGSQEQRNKIAYHLFRTWYVPLYFYGIIHGDPHLGNYTIAKDDTVNLLDFGCVRVFPAKFIEGVITLYHALERDDRELAVEAYESWGFKGLDNQTIDILNMWAGFLYGPVLDNKVRAIGVVGEKEIYGRDVAHEVHQALKKSGGVKIPREFVFMDRAALGLGSVFLHLKAEINWHQIFNELIADFDVKELDKRQKMALKKFDILA